TVKADSVITLATKTDKDAPVLKRENPTPPDFLNIAQSDKMLESRLVRLAKAIPSMIQLAIKTALQPAKDKLTSLCSTVEVLESEVGTFRKEVSALSAPPSTGHPTPREPAAMPMHPEAPRSPPDDWLGHDRDSEIVSDEETYHSRPSPPTIRSVYDVDPSWAPGIVATMSYHELRTLPDNWVVPGRERLVALPPDPLQPMAKETASWHFMSRLDSTPWMDMVLGVRSNPKSTYGLS
ncbi:hypothetical protein HAX54_047666, partial [Datura stramonium]|nr:hypothetical protein [Datura stramonium]